MNPDKCAQTFKNMKIFFVHFATGPFFFMHFYHFKQKIDVWLYFFCTNVDLFKFLKFYSK